ncbi:Rgg/GadR/MutR family transcriptional regulator [Lactovum odontotermitis]
MSRVSKNSNKPDPNFDNSAKNYLPFGRVFRSLRRSKKFSLNEAAEGVLSVSQLSKFENGQSLVNVERFFEALDNINVNVLEFQNAYNHSRDSADVVPLNFEITRAYLNKSTMKLELILDKIQKELSLHPNSKKYRLNKIHLEAVLHFLGLPRQLSLTDIDYLKKYLLNLKEWGRCDLLLFAHTMAVFDSVSLVKIAGNMISPLQINAKFNNNTRPFVLALLNLITNFIERDLLDLADRYTFYFKQLDVNEMYMYEKTMFRYHQEVLAYKRKKSQSILKNMKDYCDIFEKCGCQMTAKALTKEIEAFENGKNPRLH